MVGAELDHVLEVTDRSWPLLLERVCRQSSIEPAFQPIVDISRGVICGFEGLSRIHEPDVSAGPQEWFGAAALHGYAARLEAAALEVILAERPQLPEDCFLSVNTSPEGLLAPEVSDVINAQGDLTGLVLEITEQSPVKDYPQLVKRLHRFRDRGAIIAVDDTGAGYASIRHLLSLRPEVVKLDRSLVAGVDRDPSRAGAVSALGAFAGVLDAGIIAEGVEHLSELERLIELDVPMVQGYYLGRPSRAMNQLSPTIAAEIRRRQNQRQTDSLEFLSRPALTVFTEPATVAETTILVTEHHRPLQVFLPGGGRRAHRHAAMCVQTNEDLADIAIRAAARRTEDRFAPICVCNEIGRLVGVIPMETVIEHLATRLKKPF